MGRKKGQSGRNGRDSNGQRRGVKLYGGERAGPGNIRVRQLGNKFCPGVNVGQGREIGELECLLGDRPALISKADGCKHGAVIGRLVAEGSAGRRQHEAVGLVEHRERVAQLAGEADPAAQFGPGGQLPQFGQHRPATHDEQTRVGVLAHEVGERSDELAAAEHGLGVVFVHHRQEEGVDLTVGTLGGAVGELVADEVGLTVQEAAAVEEAERRLLEACLLYTSPSPRDS